MPARCTESAPWGGGNRDAAVMARRLPMFCGESEIGRCYCRRREVSEGKSGEKVRGVVVSVGVLSGVGPG